MPTHITVVPASTQAGRETIRVLLQSENKPSVRGIYRDPSKAPAEFLENTNFEAVKGDVGTGAGLDFQGSDAVFYIPPPTYDGTDQSEWATQTATSVKNAIQGTPSVKRLLLFSSVGSQYDHSIVWLILWTVIPCLDPIFLTSNGKIGRFATESHLRQDPRGRCARGTNHPTGVFSRGLEPRPRGGKGGFACDLLMGDARRLQGSHGRSFA